MNTTSSNKGIVLGLVGPVCAGKSEVSRRLRLLGAELYEADAIVRKLYDEPDVKRAVRKLFGDSVFDENGSVNRAEIANRVFGSQGDVTLRTRLTEEIIFPRTGQELRARIEDFRTRAGPLDVLVVDAPTLFESRRGDWCDQILLVTAPLETRRIWASTRGWDAGEMDRRDAAMIPEEEKRRCAAHVINNAGSLQDLVSAVDQLWSRLRGFDPSSPRVPSQEN